MADNIVLFDDGTHKNVLLQDFSSGLAVQANAHMIVHGKEGMILDPGGHKVYSKVLAESSSVLGGATLTTLFLSHQDPDIVAATNGWLMTTDADAYCSALWARFVPHFGLDRLVADRLKSIPDEGCWLPLDGVEVAVVPAHFLHSCGNFQIYDPISKILYTGDLGASVGCAYRAVEDFDDHLQFMAGFHRRYMGSNSAMRAWADMAATLDIDIIAPQHGALFSGKEMVRRFIDWARTVECGIDVLKDVYRLPAHA